MKFDVFIRSKKSGWYRLESFVHQYQNSKKIDPRDLAEMVRLYRSSCSDYAYAKSNFPYERVVVDLNTLIGRAHKIIYGSKPFSFNIVFRFILFDFPETFRRNLRFPVISALIFVTALLLSFIGSFSNPDLPKLLIGSQYVDMTQTNIQKNDPFAVYKQENSPVMSSFIMTNNIKVTFFAFGMGVFAGIGTIYVLFYNGLVMGVFFFIFFQNQLLLESVLTVMMHGTIELTGIFIAGGAGLLIGKALVFPGSYTRREALQIHGLLAVKLILGTAVLLVIAGIIEGFVTRIEMSAAMKGLFVLANVLFLAAYLGFSGRLGRIL